MSVTSATTKVRPRPTHLSSTVTRTTKTKTYKRDRHDREENSKREGVLNTERPRTGQLAVPWLLRASAGRTRWPNPETRCFPRRSRSSSPQQVFSSSHRYMWERHTHGTFEKVSPCPSQVTSSNDVGTYGLQRRLRNTHTYDITLAGSYLPAAGAPRAKAV